MITDDDVRDGDEDGENVDDDDLFIVLYVYWLSLALECKSHGIRDFIFITVSRRYIKDVCIFLEDT